MTALLDDHERLLLSSLLWQAQTGGDHVRHTVRSCLTLAGPAAFTDPGLEQVATAMDDLARDHVPDFVTVNAHLLAAHHTPGLTALLSLTDAAIPSTHPEQHARALRNAAALRALSVASVRAQQQLEAPDADPREVGALLMGDVELTIDRLYETPPDYGMTISDLDSLPDRDPDLVPNWLRRRNVMMITGFEGGGKTWALMQIAVELAAGLRPFTHERITPLQVLYLDYENGQDVARDRLVRLARAAARDGVPRSVIDANLRYRDLMTSMTDLADRKDEARFIADIAALRPDVVVAGPVYKMLAKDPRDDELARTFTRVLETARAKTGCAFILENHVPKQQGAHTERALMPVGSSLLARWASIGKGLRPLKVGTQDGAFLRVEEWRGSRAASVWPGVLKAVYDVGWAWVPSDEAEVELLRGAWSS